MLPTSSVACAPTGIPPVELPENKPTKGHSLLVDEDACPPLAGPADAVALNAALASGSVPATSMSLEKLRQMARRGELSRDEQLNCLLQALGDADLRSGADRGAASLYLQELQQLRNPRPGPFICGSNRWPEIDVAQALKSTYPVRPHGRQESGWPAALLRWYSRVDAFVGHDLVKRQRQIQLMQYAPGGQTALAILVKDGRSDPLRVFLYMALDARTKRRLGPQELVRVLTETGVGLPPVLGLLCDRRRQDDAQLRSYLAVLERAEREGLVPAGTLAGVLLTRDAQGAAIVSNSSPEQAAAIRDMLDRAPSGTFSGNAAAKIRDALSTGHAATTLEALPARSRLSTGVDWQFVEEAPAIELPLRDALVQGDVARIRHLLSPAGLEEADLDPIPCFQLPLRLPEDTPGAADASPERAPLAFAIVRQQPEIVRALTAALKALQKAGEISAASHQTLLLQALENNDADPGYLATRDYLKALKDFRTATRDKAAFSRDLQAHLATGRPCLMKDLRSGETDIPNERIARWINMVEACRVEGLLSREQCDSLRHTRTR